LENGHQDGLDALQNKRGTRERVQTPDETNKQTNKLSSLHVTPKVFRFYRATAIKLVHV
jgi:hypothetical protein